MPRSPYNRLSIAAKQAYELEHAREPAVACPSCGTSTPPADLVEHVRQRCAGQREPHPKSRWITWREVDELGVPSSTLTRWVQRGFVRARGERLDRQYLLRDLALRLADRRASVQQPRNLHSRRIRRKGWLSR